MASLSIVLLAVGVASATTTSARHKKPSSRHSSTVSSHKGRPRLQPASAKSRRKKSNKARGQQAIQGDRARQIQAALIREGYLKGEPSGAWDQPTKDAMTRYQADNGWQTKTLPDSRALIKLGLGPDHDGAGTTEASSSVMPAKVEPIKNSAVPQSR